MTSVHFTTGREHQTEAGKLAAQYVCDALGNAPAIEYLEPLACLIAQHKPAIINQDWLKRTAPDLAARMSADGVLSDSKCFEHVRTPWAPAPSQVAEPQPTVPRASEKPASQPEKAKRKPRPGVEPNGQAKNTDLGNAKMLVSWHGTEIRYFVGGKHWLIWDGARWRKDDTLEIERRAKATAEQMFRDAAATLGDARTAMVKWALDSQSSSRIANMVSLARSEPGIPVAASELDADPWLLNTQSGVLDLGTGALSKPTSEMLMTKVTATRYEPGAQSSLWDRFVSDLFGDDSDLRDYVQRAMGYAVFGAWREKAFWFGYGPPDGGKSTFLGVISDVLGDYAVNADASTWMTQSSNGGNRGDVVRLLGARLVTTLEVRASARFDQQLMKKVTGGDKLTYAAKYESDIEFSPTFALWFGANDRPTIPDDDEGFWSRVRCVPFIRVVPREKQDKALREKLSSPTHAPAVLSWLVAGCLAWQRQGIGTCGAVEQATTQYRRDNNEASEFFQECLSLDPKGEAGCSDVWRVYDQWARANGVRHPLTGKSLGARLRQLGVTGGDDSSRRKGQRTWFGVRLLALSDDTCGQLRADGAPPF